MNINRVAIQYLNADKELTLLKEKVPIVKDWTNKTVGKDRILNWKGNLGWKLSDEDFVIDIDPKNGGEEGFKLFVQDLKNLNPDINLEKTVITPSGGTHIYLKIPKEFQNIKFRKSINSKYPGVDFLTTGSQCVIPGSTTEKGKYKWFDDLFGFYQGEFYPEIVKLIGSNSNNVRNIKEDLGDFTGLIGGKSSNWSEEKVKELLSLLSPSMSYNEWIKVGMALHDWDTILGFELWEEWSKEGDNYSVNETIKHWDSFTTSGGVTLGTISYMAREVTWDQENSIVENFQIRIATADTKELEFEIIKEIANIDFAIQNKEKLAKFIQSRYKELIDQNMAIGVVRKMVNSSKDNVVKGRFLEDSKLPEWTYDWIYINNHDAYAKLSDLTIHKGSSFNHECGKYVPETEGGSKLSASKYCADNGYVEKVESTIYLPQSKDVTIHVPGHGRLLNMFNPNSVPEASPTYDSEGLETVEMVRRHIKIIFGEKNNLIMEQWIAHNVQNMGSKILWSPFVISIQGVGKSLFSTLMRAMIGNQNVNVISPQQLISNFNGWAGNSCVNFCEEVRLPGKNRYEAMNGLKPLITDRWIQINEKNIKSYQLLNVTNYCAFSNDKNALPMTEDDRRWWIIMCPLQELSEINDLVGMDYKDYFPTIFDRLKRHGDQLRKFFLEYEITKEFKRMNQAPITKYKKQMIATEESFVEGLAEARELISNGGQYFNKKVISSSDFWEQMMFDYEYLDLNNTNKNHIMRKLGYSVHDANPMKIDGKNRRIYTLIPMTNDEIRGSLKGLDVLIP